MDLVIDNSKFDVPKSESARQYRKVSKIRFTHRTRKEGLDANHTKPHPTKHRDGGGKVQSSNPSRLPLSRNPARYLTVRAVVMPRCYPSTPVRASRTRAPN